jgi:hypothetical protein
MMVLLSASPLELLYIDFQDKLMDVGFGQTLDTSIYFDIIEFAGICHLCG